MRYIFHRFSVLSIGSNAYSPASDHAYQDVISLAAICVSA
jgi:hypothetical protein